MLAAMIEALTFPNTSFYSVRNVNQKRSFC